MNVQRERSTPTAPNARLRGEMKDTVDVREEIGKGRFREVGLDEIEADVVSRLLEVLFL